jgi:outer membrane lipoprotein-sorting protein
VREKNRAVQTWAQFAHLFLYARIKSTGNLRPIHPSQGLILKRLLCITALLGLGAMVCVARLRAAQSTGHWTTQTVLAMMDKSAADFRSLTADIEHTKYTEVVKDTSTETGQIFVRRDQKMRIEISKPDPRTILRTGDSLFVYTPKIKRVEEIDLGKDRAMLDQYLLLGFGSKSQNILKSYDVALTGEDEIDHRKTFVLELTPKSEAIRRQITKIQMWIDPSSWLPLQQKFFEGESGDYFLSHYSNMMKNLKISDAKFKQDWPKDVTRVKPRG